MLLIYLKIINYLCYILHDLNIIKKIEIINHNLKKIGNYNNGYNLLLTMRIKL